MRSPPTLPPPQNLKRALSPLRVNYLLSFLFQSLLLIGQTGLQTSQMTLRRNSNLAFEQRTMLGFARLRGFHNSLRYFNHHVTNRWYALLVRKDLLEHFGKYCMYCTHKYEKWNITKNLPHSQAEAGELSDLFLMLSSQR